MFFNNWSKLYHHFRSTGIHAVGTIQLNRSRGCPLDANKNLMKNRRDAMDYHCNRNSGMMAVKRVDSSVVNLVLHFVGVKPIAELERWFRKEKVRKNTPCPQIFQQYNKRMRGVVSYH